MKNLLHEKVTRQQRKAMELTGAPTVLFAMILWKLLKLSVRFLKRFHRGIRRSLTFMVVFIGLLITFTTDFSKVAHAPVSAGMIETQNQRYEAFMQTQLEINKLENEWREAQEIVNKHLMEK